MKKIIAILFLTGIYTASSAQSIRGLVNNGVDSYKENKYAEAEVEFKKGIEKDVENFESRFNLGDAVYKQNRYGEAMEEFKNSFPLAKTDEAKSKIFHNIGNSLLKDKKLKESIGAYREALKLNPNDLETKYNLSYAIKQMQNQQNQQNQDNKDQKDQNKDDQNKDQNKDDQNKDQQDNKDDKQQQPEDKKEQKDQQNQQQKPEPKDEISKDEAQRILDALKNNEAELQKKMREQKTKKTNVEKDW